MNQISLNSIIQASNAIIVDPSKSLKDFDIDYMLITVSPALFLVRKIFDSVRKKDREEKERMYRQIIAKQQAAIKKLQEVNRKLEIQLQEADCQNDNNRREIARLREQVKNIEEVIELLRQSANQIDS